MHVYRSKSGNFSVKLRMFARDFRIGANYAQPKDASKVAKNAFLHCRVNQQGILSLSKEVSKAGMCNTINKKYALKAKNVHEILRDFVRVQNSRWIRKKRKLNVKKVGSSKLKSEEEVHLLNSMKDVYMSDIKELKRRVDLIRSSLTETADSIRKLSTKNVSSSSSSSSSSPRILKRNSSLYGHVHSCMLHIEKVSVFGELYKRKLLEIPKNMSPKKRPKQL